jgi:hypothetical protein
MMHGTTNIKTGNLTGIHVIFPQSLHDSCGRESLSQTSHGCIFPVLSNSLYPLFILSVFGTGIFYSTRHFLFSIG